MESTDKISHPIYAPADPKDADCCSWSFLTKEKFGKYHHKFQPMEDNHVRCRVLHTSLCMSDVHTGRDKWGGSMKPCCPGHEAIGEVIELGSKVTQFKIGDIVGFGPMRDACLKCEVCKKGATNLCPVTDGTEKFLYGLYFGGYSTHIQHPETCVVKIPEGLDITTAPPLLCAGITVYSPLAKFVKPGMKVGIIGVGGLGHLAVQIAHKMGASVDGFTSSPSKEAFIKELGAEGIVLWREKNYASKIENKYDVLVNTTSVKVTRNCFENFAKCIKPLGTYIQLGLPDSEDNFEADYFSFILKNITIYGSLVGSVNETKECLEFCAKNNIVCKTEHYSWEEFPKALDKLENGKPMFRCVVNVDDESKKYMK